MTLHPFAASRARHPAGGRDAPRGRKDTHRASKAVMETSTA